MCNILFFKHLIVRIFLYGIQLVELIEFLSYLFFEKISFDALKKTVRPGLTVFFGILDQNYVISMYYVIILNKSQIWLKQLGTKANLYRIIMY